MSVPSAPLSVTAVAAPGSALVTWDTPLSDGGSPILGYLIVTSASASPNQQSYIPAAPTSFYMTGLSAVSQHFTVYAYNASGASPGAASGSVTPTTDHLNTYQTLNTRYYILVIGVVWVGGASISNVDMAAWFDQGSEDAWTVSQEWGRQGDTANMCLVDEHADGQCSFAIPSLTTVQWTDTTYDKSLFGGVVTNPQWQERSPNLSVWTLACTDWVYYADTTYVVGEFSFQTADQILIELVTKANCGIKAALISNGGYIAPGPVIPYFRANYAKLSAVFSEVVKRASQSVTWGWYVDDDRSLHAYGLNQLSEASGISFTDVPVETGATPLLGFYQADDTSFKYEWDGTQVYTSDIVRGSSITSHRIDTFVTDGSAKQSMPLTYALHVETSSTGISAVVGFGSSVVVGKSGQPTLSGGIQEPVAISAQGVKPTTPLVLTQAANLQWFLTYGTSGPLAPGTKLLLMYKYDQPIVARADNLPLQKEYGGYNRGIFQTSVQDKGLLNWAQAFQIAQSEIIRYGQPQERITFTTTDDWPGHIQVGETFEWTNALTPDSENNYQPGISRTFMATSITISPSSKGAGFRTYQITGVRTV
jgi:hypothetical protein